MRRRTATTNNVVPTPSVSVVTKFWVVIVMSPELEAPPELSSPPREFPVLVGSEVVEYPTVSGRHRSSQSMKRVLSQLQENN